MLFCFSHVDIEMTENSGRDVWLTLSYMFSDKPKKYSKLLFLKVYLEYMFIHVCVYVSTGACGIQKRVLVPLELN